jgi:hypothetical protein
MKNSQLLNDLIRLRDFFSSHKRWRKGHLGDGSRYCIMGGINHVILQELVREEKQFLCSPKKVKRGWELTKAIAAAWNLPTAEILDEESNRERVVEKLIERNDNSKTRFTHIAAVIDCAIKTEMEKQTLKIAKAATAPAKEEKEKEKELA